MELTLIELDPHVVAIAAPTASTFPTASGVNPMLSIYAIAHRAAGKIAARLA